MIIKKREEGFTLIELTVVIGLIVIVVSTVTSIFSSSSATTEDLESSINAIKQARYFLDTVEEDLSQLDVFDGRQFFVLENAYYDRKTGDFFWEYEDEKAKTKDEKMEIHTIRAADAMVFRGMVKVGDTMQHAEVRYYLTPVRDTKGGFILKGEKSKSVHTSVIRDVRVKSGQGSGIITTGATLNNVGPRHLNRKSLKELEDDKDTKVKKTAKSGDAILRASKDQFIAGGSDDVFNEQPKDSRGKPLPVQDRIADYVLSFNIEFLASNNRFSQLAPSPCPITDPLGDGAGRNDADETAITIPALRLSVIVADSLKENTIQMYDRVIPLNIRFE